MADNKVKIKLKEKIDRIRRKMKRRKQHGSVNIPGVSGAKKPVVKESKPEFRAPKKKKTVAVGPKGGKFTVSSGGKKLYQRGAKSQEAMNKSLLNEIIQETRFQEFFKSFRMRGE